MGLAPRATQGAVPEELQDGSLEGAPGRAGRSSCLLLKCAAFPSSDLPACSGTSHGDRQSCCQLGLLPPTPLLSSSLAELPQMFSPIFCDWI